MLIGLLKCRTLIRDVDMGITKETMAMIDAMFPCAQLRIACRSRVSVVTTHLAESAFSPEGTNCAAF